MSKKISQERNETAIDSSSALGTMSTCSVSKYLCLPWQDSPSHLSWVLSGQMLTLQVETSTQEQADRARAKLIYYGSSSLAGASGRDLGSCLRTE